MAKRIKKSSFSGSATLSHYLPSWHQCPKLDGIFGLMDEDNDICRFRAMITRESKFSDNLRVKILYLENRPLDCTMKIKLVRKYKGHEIHLLKTTVDVEDMACFISDPLRDPCRFAGESRLWLCISIAARHSSKKVQFSAKKFNDEKSSDFKGNLCQPTKSTGFLNIFPFFQLFVKTPLFSFTQIF